MGTTRHRKVCFGWAFLGLLTSKSPYAPVRITEVIVDSASLWHADVLSHVVMWRAAQVDARIPISSVAFLGTNVAKRAQFLTLQQQVMPSFDPFRSTTNDVVREVRDREISA